MRTNPCTVLPAPSLSHSTAFSRLFIVFHTHSIARERAYYGVHGAVIAYFSKLFFIAHLLGAIAANGQDDWHSLHTLSVLVALLLLHGHAH